MSAFGQSSLLIVTASTVTVYTLAALGRLEVFA